MTDMTTPISTQIATAMCSVGLAVPRAVANRAGQRLPGLRTEKEHEGHEQFRFHVMIRSRFIFR